MLRDAPTFVVANRAISVIANSPRLDEEFFSHVARDRCVKDHAVGDGIPIAGTWSVWMHGTGWGVRRTAVVQNWHELRSSEGSVDSLCLKVGHHVLVGTVVHEETCARRTALQ